MARFDPFETALMQHHYISGVSREQNSAHTR